LYNIQPISKIIGKNHVFVPSCHSTNDLALEIIQNSENFHGTVILADYQTQGRGQKGNAWESESGQNLIFSVALDTSFLKIENQFYLSMAMSLAMCNTLRELGFFNTKIKWPNDIFLDEKKIGGMLIENKIRGVYLRASVLGIGINVLQEKFNSKIASSLILNDLNSKISLPILAEKLCEHIEQQFEKLKKGEFEYIHLQYLKIIYKLGKKQIFEKNTEQFTAKIQSIDRDGRLVLKIGNGVQKFEIKEVKYVF
jgi:BirA family transcriptional regulator, biotin operon repressor / biotin---[acetyl-CoA-carboxylase] ligase